MPGEVQRGIASVFKAAMWSLYTGLGQYWVFPTGLLCVSGSCVGRFSAPVLKMAVKKQQENRQLTTVLETTEKLKTSPKHLEKCVYVLVTWPLLILASSDVLGLIVSSMWGTQLLHGTL